MFLVEAVDSLSSVVRLSAKLGERARPQRRLDVADHLASLHRIRRANRLRQQGLHFELDQRRPQVLRRVQRLPQYAGRFFIAILREVELAQRSPQVCLL